MKAPLDGGAAETLASGQLFPCGVALNAGHLHWIPNFDPGSVAVSDYGVQKHER